MGSLLPNDASKRGDGCGVSRRLASVASGRVEHEDVVLGHRVRADLRCLDELEPLRLELGQSRRCVVRSLTHAVQSARADARRTWSELQIER